MLEHKKNIGTVVTGVIGEDVHIVGIRIMEYALGDSGFNVVPLGSQVTQEEFVGAAMETQANALLISSLSGHAETLIPGLRKKCTASGLENILIYLGGYLMVGKETEWDHIEKKFKAMGIDRIFPPGTSPTDAIKKLKIDLSEKQGK